MRKVIVALIGLLLISFSTVSPYAQSSVNQRFPAVEEGVWYFYNTTRVGSFAHKPLILTWAYNYSILDVSGDKVVYQLVSYCYEDGTLVKTSNATFTVTNVSLVDRFGVFFDVTKLRDSLERLLYGYAGHNYTITNVTYTFNNRTLDCYNGSYRTKWWWGYFIVSKEFGLVLEVAQFAVTYNLEIAPQNAVVKLVATNFRKLLGLWWFIPYIPEELLCVIIVAVIIAVVMLPYILLRRRK